MRRILIFPEPFRIQSPEPEEQYEYLSSWSRDEAVMKGTGRFVQVNALSRKDYAKEIRRVIAEQKPDWVIVAGESATACVNLYRQRKILINPVLTFDDLNNVPEYARRHTYGFFGALPEQEESYERFQTVYPDAAWYPDAPDLRMADLADMIRGIVGQGD